ncbi:molecular chaperone DjiA [Rhodobacter sp. KR11]|jgi:DnaJ like chaperone protein|uniref:molecular chaperone DjiA n=1 Tax=Rhodobacter sp. KR11 TaxID=2974588 RepID=UPI0022229182|nr:molecular chaperone DjiA [Rhodobacter sp. KR11]MCW1920502.1 molecular chaperone DjiA [Rhodobacter sp. KR11]
MSLWSRIVEAISSLATGQGLAEVFDRFRSPPEKSVAFTIAVIALGAKMAKADGEVTRGEVAAFRRVFVIPPGEEDAAARVFNLARQDVAGFDAYARKIAAMFPGDREVLIDLMEGLFHIALADGSFHPGEEAFLTEVARIFGLDQRCFAALRARHVPGDPYAVLGVDPGAPLDEVRRAWAQAVRASHPDGMIARGVPPEAVRLAEDRMRAINAAWDVIQKRAA